MLVGKTATWDVKKIDKTLKEWLENIKPVITNALSEIIKYFDSLKRFGYIIDFQTKLIHYSMIRIDFKKGSYSYVRYVAFQNGVYHDYTLMQFEGHKRKALEDAYDRAMKGIV
jgi:hypothetical protein